MDMVDVHILPIFLKFFFICFLREAVLARLERVSPGIPMEKRTIHTVQGWASALGMAEALKRADKAGGQANKRSRRLARPARSKCPGGGRSARWASHLFAANHCSKGRRAGPPGL